MGRQFVVKARFWRAYERLAPPDRALVTNALALFQQYRETGEAPSGFGLKKLGPGVYEFRAGLALRVVSVEEGPVLALALLGSHDEVRRFLRRS